MRVYKNWPGASAPSTASILGTAPRRSKQKIPEQPKLFALIHELKHHYCDRTALGSGVIHCGDYDRNELIEKGAEVFAAEFIYPEAEFAEDFSRGRSDNAAGRSCCGVQTLLQGQVSYRFICKRLERLGLISLGSFDSIHFQKLEEQIHGVPFYRRTRR